MYDFASLSQQLKTWLPRFYPSNPNKVDLSNFSHQNVLLPQHSSSFERHGWAISMLCTMFMSLSRMGCWNHCKFSLDRSSYLELFSRVFSRLMHQCLIAKWGTLVHNLKEISTTQLPIETIVATVGKSGNMLDLQTDITYDCNGGDKTIWFKVGSFCKIIHELLTKIQRIIVLFVFSGVNKFCLSVSRLECSIYEGRQLRLLGLVFWSQSYAAVVP